MTHRFTFVAAVAASFSLATVAQAEKHQSADAGSLCESGYSATDVDNNGYISTIEMNAYAERSATEMDNDQSGAISRDEFVNCNNAMSGTKSASAQRTEEDMAALDKDGDGSLTQSEYMTGSAELQQKASGGDEDAADASMRVIFMPDAMAEQDATEMSQDAYAARSGLMFIALDQDKDDVMTREEFMAETPPMVDISETLNRQFDEMDTDKSGDLTQTELIQANQKRAERAMERAKEDGVELSDEGAPVVYYRYPDAM